MPYHHPFQITAFHSCDKEIGVKVLNGEIDLKPSNNLWDWLGHGVYFWEENPVRALDYSRESAIGKQFNKTQIKVPFIIGAIIELGNCLNLVESASLSIVEETYNKLSQSIISIGEKMPVNEGNNKALDCAVFQYIHQTNREAGKQPYDTIRCAFQEGGEIYPGSTISKRLHIQVCVINPDCIKVTSCRSHILFLIRTFNGTLGSFSYTVIICHSKHPYAPECSKRTHTKIYQQITCQTDAVLPPLSAYFPIPKKTQPHKRKRNRQHQFIQCHHPPV